MSKNTFDYEFLSSADLLKSMYRRGTADLLTVSSLGHLDSRTGLKQSDLKAVSKAIKDATITGVGLWVIKSGSVTPRNK